MLPSHVDVAIIGGGPVGCYLANALAAQGKSVCVLEKESQPRSDDPRMLAISAGGKQLLSNLGCWDSILEDSPISYVSVTQKGYLGHTELSASEIGENVLGYVVPYQRLHPLLVSRVKAPASYIPQTEVSNIQFTSAYAVIQYQQSTESSAQKELTARLVVLADGGQLASKVGQIEYKERDYEQSALITLVQAEFQPRDTAFERFVEDGAIALLPRPGGYALIWTGPTSLSEERKSWSDTELLKALQAQLGSKAGKFTAVGARHLVPLKLRYAKTLVSPRCVVIGNAAQYLHPIAGQGLNLGLRDAHDLALLLSKHPDPGSESCLSRYPSIRRLDKLNGVGFTDSLIRLFGVPKLGHARGLGLMALEAMPPLKRKLLGHLAYGIRGNV
ncbi:FAD-dependent monooxygenase [Leeia sp. TBRC 13508]|uniref:FAD-dependent monooxygenase n=1 Tax=Leeia speluncae TaxID=2884804 RepID=A0ABS8D6J2_9NEIS|nr:FAD-dependent oxidoreductase [Leeia speluncae]MCB6183815.1 FAD-dependent monooxygenase [Leeia speluncae]